MRYYAYWLDPEFSRLARMEADTAANPSADTEALRALKLHALFGNQIVLNDIQLIDSPILQKLFSDEAFLGYIRDQGRRFFELIAAPTEGATPRRFDIATSGLRRATRSGWSSSSLSTAEPIVELANIILQHGDTDPAFVLHHRQSGRSLLDRWRDHRHQLMAISNGVHHFASVTGGAPWQPSEKKPRTLYDVLLELRGRPGIRANDEKRIEDTLRFIETFVPAEDRGYRSRIRAVLESSDWSSRPVVAHTVAYAWSYAAEETLRLSGQSLGASIGDLTSGALVPLFHSAPSDALFDIERAEGHRLLSAWKDRMATRLAWDPGTLNWATIRRLIEDTLDSREALQHEMTTGDNTSQREALISHVRRLVSRPPLRYEPPDPVPPALWLIGGATGVIAGLLVGNPELSRIWGEAAVVARGAYGTVQACVRRTGRFRVVHTLGAVGRRMLRMS